MFLKRTRVRSGKNTHTYLQLVQAYREGGRPRQRVVATLGREDQIDPAQIDRLVASLAPYGSRKRVGDADVSLLPGRAFGHVWALEHLWRELRLDRILEDLARPRFARFSLPDVVEAIVFGRVVRPSSDRALVREWLEGVEAPRFAGIQLHQVYRALRFLAEVQGELQRRLALVLTQQLFADVSLVLFDTSSVYFEGMGPELAERGYSRDHRPDRPQVNLGLLTSREGYPLAHWLFEGNRSDVGAFAEASRTFRDLLPAGSFVVVADRGVVSRENLENLQAEGIPYIVGERLRRKLAREALARGGRYRKAAEGLQVKEIRREGSERVLVCFSAEQAERDRQERERIVERLQEKLQDAGWRSLLPPSARRYVDLEASEPRIDWAKVREDARYDGKWVLRTTSTLSPEEVALSYRGLWRMERAFRTMKTPLEIRPVYHWSEDGVRGHVQSCVLAYLLVRLIEDRLQRAGLEPNARVALEKLAQIQRIPLEVADRTVVKTTRLSEEHRRILQALRVPEPAEVQVA